MNNKLLSIIAVFIGILLPMKMQAQMGDNISVPEFTFEGDNLVMTCETQGADIYYVMSEFANEEEAESLREELDVSEQNSMRTLYTQPIPVTSNVVIKAVAKMPGQVGDSDVRTLVYSYTAWHQLMEAVEYGSEVLARAQNNPDVSDDLKDHLRWLIEEGEMIYGYRGQMEDSYEAEHFTNEIMEIAHEIEELLGPVQTGPEPYAVLSQNNTVLTFYYDENKGQRNGMGVGPFVQPIVVDGDDYYSTIWNTDSRNIRRVVFDASFDNCTTITSTDQWFSYFSNLTEIVDLKYLHTQNVTSMNDMFVGCSKLNQLDLSHFNTANVTRMASMFAKCSGLTKLDLTVFNTANVTNMASMFSECQNLTTIYAGEGWSTAKVTEGNSTFYNCSSLIGGAGTRYDANHTDYPYAHIDGGRDNPGYLTDINVPYIPEVMLTGKVANYWYDVTGTDPNGDEAIIFTLPRTPEGGNIWEVNVLNTFVRNQLAFTTPDGQAVNNTIGEIRFESNEHMVALNDGKMLMYESENEQGEIGMVEPDLGMIRIINSDITQHLLNDPNSKYMALPVTATAYRYGYEVPVINGSFTVLIQLEKPQDPEPYAVLSRSNNNTVLTFYYDTNKATFQESMSIDPNNWSGNASAITTVVFDASFANYTALTSTARWFSKFAKLTSIQGLNNLRTDNVTDMGWMFSGCTSLTSLDVSGFNTAKVTDMGGLFEHCSSLKTIDVSKFITDNVTNMDEMFEGCSALTTLDLNEFRTGNVTSMESMFGSCSSLTSLNLSRFNTAKVTDMSGLFRDCTKLQTVNVSGFNTSNVKDMEYMFSRCSSLTSLDLSSFATGSLQDIDGMFEECSALTTIYVTSNWDASKVTNSREMFFGCTSLVGGAGTAYSPQHMDVSYAHIDGGTANPGYFTDKNAPTSRELFVLSNENGMIIGSIVAPNGETQRFEIVGGKEAIFNVPNGSNVNMTFRPNAGYRLADVILNGRSVRSQMPTDSTYVIQNVLENMELMVTFDALPMEPYAVLSNNNTVLTFYYDSNKERMNGMSVGSSTNFIGWNEQKEAITTVVFDASFANCATLTSTAYWFSNCKNLTSITGLSNLKTDHVTNMAEMFAKCSSLTNLDLSSFNTENVTTMEMMFNGCESLTSLNVSSFNTSKVTNMFQMFGSCRNLTSLDLSSFNTENVTTMYHMFSGCSDLESLDVSNFNTENLTIMSGMFQACSSLTSIDVSELNTENVTDMSQLFYYCTNLVNINLNNLNTSKVESFSLIFANCPNLASIIAGSANIPAAQYAETGNPNLLVYVNEPSLAPEGIQNVVINGVAQEIILTDVTEGNNNWNCPEEFRAEKITYTRNFKQQTEVGISRGWESIALPFTVHTITHDSQGPIIPFGAQGTGKYFWLRGYSPEGLHRATVLEANTPYVISMPNNPTVYPYEYNLNGHVTFSAENTIVPATPDFEEMLITRGNITMAPIFVLVPRDEAVYAINVGQPLDRYAEGSVFTRELREVRPFEAATTHEPVNGARPQNIRIAAQPNYDITGIKTIELDETEGTWFSLDGRQIQGQPQRKGVYLQKGKKVVIK
ncbi:MAG: BspA family leucine-rich repeat surface protein [Prevotella sp.]|nr:BspA family leucine-rich repeat surface protein [Prevotella sp.]